MTFKGFRDGKTRHAQIPVQFFSDLLPQIDDLAELKVTLFCFWALPQKEGKHRFLRRCDFLDNQTLMQGLPLSEAMTPEQVLETALGRALQRGTLLCGQANGETLYFMNTEKGRAGLFQLEAETITSDQNGRAVEVLPERPNIYALYEANIGLIDSPMLAEKLKHAERDYPAQWVADAIQEAVVRNKRNWRFIESVLKRWQTEGRDNEAHGGYVERNGQRKIAGNIEDFIKR
jgi:DnaD/phage-associated family protein